MNNVQVFPLISEDKLEEILNGIRNIKVGLIGDICLDVYWKADMTKSELSRETPHFPLPVTDEYMSPGAGGNVAANIAALKPAWLDIISMTGNDWRGRELVISLSRQHINISNIISSNTVTTNAFCKPIRKGLSHVEYEDPRIDFANYAPPAEAVEAELLARLKQAAQNIDVLCVADQFLYGCITPKIRSEIIKLAKSGLRVVVDSRDRIGLFTDVIMKPNEVEGIRAVFPGKVPANSSVDEQINAALILSQEKNSVVCMTLGEKGCCFVENGIATRIASYKVDPPIDICGAGDTFMSAFSCALAAGATGCEAASFANIASQVTIRKINTTGTASPDEIRERYNQIRNRS